VGGIAAASACVTLATLREHHLYLGVIAEASPVNSVAINIEYSTVWRVQHDGQFATDRGQRAP
jgi:hypothetical protein